MQTFNDEDKQALIAFKTVADSDDIRFKEIIKNTLLNNRFILHVLNNQELENDPDTVPEDYYETNIFPYYQINTTQTNVQNYICYETSFNEESRYNDMVKYGQVIFYILCEQKNVIDTETDIPKHDLLAALIMDEFNWSNIFGGQVRCVSNKPSVVDTKYACRTLIFEGRFNNSIAKTNNRIRKENDPNNPGTRIVSEKYYGINK